MAGEDDDLVAKLVIEGLEQAAADIKKLAAEGGASFDQLAAAAAAAGKKTEDAGERIAKGSTAAADGMTRVAKVDFPPGFQQRLDQIAPRLQAFRGSLQKVVTSIGRFSQRIALLSTGAAAAGVAFAEGARRVALGADEQESALSKTTKSLVESNNTALDARVAQIGLASSQRQLQGQFARGEITFDQYSKSLRQLNLDFREQQRVARETADAQRAVAEDNQRLQDQLKKTEAYNKLITMFGGPLTSSLVSFGNRIETVRSQLVQAFSPAIGAGVDQLTSVISRNSNAINKYFTDASNRTAQFIQENGPAIQRVLESMGKAAAAVFDGLLAAGPSIIAFFEGFVIPGIKSVIGAFESVATTINDVFGTKITGGFLLLIFLAAQFTGALRLMFSLFRSGSLLVSAMTSIFGALSTGGLLPLIVVIGLVVAGLYLLFRAIDWKAWGAAAAGAANSIVTAFRNVLNWFAAFPGNLTAIFSFLWSYITAGWTVVSQGIITAFQTVLDWFLAFPGNLSTLFTALWGVIQAGWAAVAKFVIDNWTKVYDYFAAFPDNLSAILTTVWDAIRNGFKAAFDYVAGVVQGWVTNVMTWLKPVLDGLKKALALFGAVQAASGSEGGGQGFARGGHVRGAGTSTSDSIAAWLSNNEFVVKAKAVRKYGTGLLNAINSGRFNLDGMMGFAAGGLVSMPSLGGAYQAAGSLPRGGGRGSDSGPMSVLNLTLGGETYAGLLAPDEVAGRLARAAVAKKVRSAGRPPGWNG